MELFQMLAESFWPMFKAGLLISVPLMLVSFALGLVLVLGLGDGTQEGKKPSPRRREGGPEGAG